MTLNRDEILFAELLSLHSLSLKVLEKRIKSRIKQLKKQNHLYGDFFLNHIIFRFNRILELFNKVEFRILFRKVKNSKK